MPKLEQAFQEMMHKSFPNDELDTVGIQQITDMRRCFMAGAIEVTTLLLIDANNEQDIIEELSNFSNKVKSGQA